MITLKLKLKEQDIELTMNEAKELYVELESLFARKEAFNPLTYPYPTAPYISDTGPPNNIFGTGITDTHILS